MTLDQLQERTKIQKAGWGSYLVTITFRGKNYRCMSNNSLAYDDYQAEGHRSYYTTDKQCLKAFYDECKQKNGLNDY